MYFNTNSYGFHLVSPRYEIYIILTHLAYNKGNNLRHSIDVLNTTGGAIFDLQGQFSPS